VEAVEGRAPISFSCQMVGGGSVLNALGQVPSSHVPLWMTRTSKAGVWEKPCEAEAIFVEVVGAKRKYLHSELRETPL